MKIALYIIIHVLEFVSSIYTYIFGLCVALFKISQIKVDFVHV